MSFHKTYLVRTLGCKANMYDSQLIEAELQKRGWQPLADTGSASRGTPLNADLCIVNSCTVTDEADRQTRKMAARLLRENPDARVVVTGCGAEVDPERLARSQGVHYVIGNRNKPNLVELILQKFEESRPDAASGGRIIDAETGPVGYAEMFSRHPMDREWPLAESSFIRPPVHLDGHSGKTRAFLKIQEGCNSFCTYCVIPYGRGPSRSLRPVEVISQVRELVSEGIREVVITGTNIGDYGTDLGSEPMLTQLLEMIFKETDLQRLRVSSLDPTEITDSMLELMSREKRFCPHFHVSLQSPDTRILKLMKRRYGFQQVKDCLEKINAIPAPVGGVFVGMDVITGFPGESDEDFERTYQALASLPWSRLHVFPYSEREGTPATRLPGVVPREKRLERTQKLKALSLQRLNEIHEKVLKTCQAGGQELTGILMEKPMKIDGVLRASGYTANYLRVILDQDGHDGQDIPERNDLISAQPLFIHQDVVAGDAAFMARISSKNS
jgi:threonylcarbamoyladenosine tRNA methylthiotransferase MtaB